VAGPDAERGPAPAGAPPLRTFGLVLHHDGRWSHEGVPILNPRLRAAFDRSVRFLPEAPGRASEARSEPQASEGSSDRAAQRGEAERRAIEPGCFVVQLGRFRGWIEVEEAAFFVRDFDAATGAIRLSDGSSEPLDPGTLRLSPRDGAGLCAVKRSLAPPDGVLARFGHAAWAALLDALEGPESAPRLRVGARSVPLPERVLEALAGDPARV
jgi:hypothetical protein